MLFEKLGLIGPAVVGVSMFVAGAAQADDVTPHDADQAAPVAARGEGPKPDAKPKADVDDDGARFRGGISGGAGALIFPDAGVVAGLGDIDARLGVQVMDLLGIYVQPQIALGAGSGAFAGSVGASVVADFTFIDQIFVGIGGGGGLVQFGGTEGGGELHIRAGGYPVFGYGEDGIRRKGLMLAADLRVHFVAGSVLVSPIFSVGYEAF